MALSYTDEKPKCQGKILVSLPKFVPNLCYKGLFLVKLLSIQFFLSFTWENNTVWAFKMIILKGSRNVKHVFKKTIENIKFHTLIGSHDLKVVSHVITDRTALIAIGL